MKQSYQDQDLSESVVSMEDGHNSFSLTASGVKSSEIPSGNDTIIDDNGAATTRMGWEAASPVFPQAYPVAALGEITKSGLYKRLALVGDKAYSYTVGAVSELTGFTFTPQEAPSCRIAQMVGRTYFCNGVDQPYYTTDGLALTLQTGAFPMKFPVYYNARLYCVRPDYPDRIYYSNPISVDLTVTGAEPATYTLSNFGTFAVDLSLTPKKNAGFIILLPDSGVEITCLRQKGSTILVTTKQHGEWEVTADPTPLANGTIAHTVQQTVAVGGVPAPLSVFPSDNDWGFYGGANFYYYGEVALYAQPRTTPKSGRIQSHMRAIPDSMKYKVAGVQFYNEEILAYGLGERNDRLIIRNKIRNAWSTPLTGIAVSCFSVTRSSGGDELLAGMDTQASPRVMKLFTSSTDNGAPISASFRDKADPCKDDKLVKRFAFCKAKLSEVIGGFSWNAYCGERLVRSGNYVVPGSGTAIGGVGVERPGMFRPGYGSATSTTSPVKRDIVVPLNVGYAPGYTLQIEYITSGGQRVRVLDRKTYYDKGDKNESISQ